MGDWIGKCRSTRRRLLAVGVLAGLALAIAGCGGNARPTLPHDRFAKARSLFREICAGCHTLANAGAHGNRLRLDVGLDDPTKIASNARSTIEEGDAGMPEWRGSLTPREIALLASYVAAAADRPSGPPDGRLATTLTPRPDPNRTRPPPARFADGKAIFKELCAGCHALADANAHGTRVDLDAALAPIPRADRAATVLKALRDSNAMPDWTWRLSGSEVDSLVRYVSAVAGRGR
jgi:mono/diheme cytochrome c family protein